MPSPRVQVPGGGLAAVRKAKGFTQVTLAEAVRCSDTLIALIETGRRQPSYETACAIAAALGVPLDTIATVTDEEVVA